MKKYIEYFIPFFIGAILYSAIEILWRGHTHWTMFLAGGICLTVIYFLYKNCRSVSLLLRCAVGSVVILAVEFLTGFTVNIVLQWNIWDYSDMALNLYGQICPLYAVFWFLLCIPANWISAVIAKLTDQQYSE